MLAKTAQPWHAHEKFGAYKFINVSWGSEETKGHSLRNLHECDVALDLYRHLIHEFSRSMPFVRVGVISMYKAQIAELKKRFSKDLGDGILKSIDFNTVDGFQGQEKDVVILSCVRSGPGLQTVGFLSGIFCLYSHFLLNVNAIHRYQTNERCIDKGQIIVIYYWKCSYFRAE